MNVGIFVDLDHTIINKIGRSNKRKEMEHVNNAFNMMSEQEKLAFLSSIDERTQKHVFFGETKKFVVTSIIRPNGIELLEALSQIPNADMFILSHGSENHINSAIDAFNIRKYFNGIFCSRGSEINTQNNYDVSILIDDKFNPNIADGPKNKRKRDNDAMHKKHDLMLSRSRVIEHIRVPPYDLFDEVRNVETVNEDSLDVENVIMQINRIISDYQSDYTQ